MGKYLKMADVLPNGVVISPLHSEIQQQYADHAINSHDVLVAEVGRLRDMVIRMQSYLDMAGEYPEKESDNPVRQWLFDAIDCTK